MRRRTEIHARQFIGARRRLSTGIAELTGAVSSPSSVSGGGCSSCAIAIFDNRRTVAVINRGSAAPRCDRHVCAHVQSGSAIFPPWTDIPAWRYSYDFQGKALLSARDTSDSRESGMNRLRKIRDPYPPGISNFTTCSTSVASFVAGTSLPPLLPLHPIKFVDRDVEDPAGPDGLTATDTHLSEMGSLRKRYIARIDQSEIAYPMGKNGFQNLFGLHQQRLQFINNKTIREWSPRSKKVYDTIA